MFILLLRETLMGLGVDVIVVVLCLGGADSDGSQRG